MKLIPILFSTPMVQAILQDCKTMTRRVIKQKDQPYLKYENSFIDNSDGFGWVVKHLVGQNPIRYEITQKFKCPYGQIGDVLWVRETFSEDADKSGKYFFKADYPTAPKWKPNIFMPKSACRTFLEITNIRVERLQDISEQDAIAEGIEYKRFDMQGLGYKVYGCGSENQMTSLPCVSFKSLWQSINGEDSWEANPYVWVIEFKRIEKPENFN